MTPTTRTIASAVGAFLVAGLIAFFAGQSIGSDGTPSAVAPTAPAVEPVLVAQQIAPDADPVEAILARAEQEAAAREVASEVGAPLDAASGGFGVGVSDPAPPPSSEEPAPAEEPEPPLPTGPSGDGAPAIGIFEDACADGGDGCPEGVGGFVLSAIRAVPPLRGMTYWQPGEDGAFDWTPTCPEIDVPAGAASFGASTSRPVTITIRYRAGRWTGGGYEVEGTFTFTTPDASEAGWNDWIADDTASDADPRAWIKQCFLIEDLPARDDYIAFIDYADKYDPTITAANMPYRVDFDVFLDSGFLPGEQRRPTFLLGNGIDELLIGVTARPDHRFAAVALQDAAPGACDTGGDEQARIGDTDLRRSQEVSDEPISEDRLSDPSYPYLPEHTRSLVHRLWLQEGSNYLICMYWLQEGTSFDRTVVDIAEEAQVSTPEAYRPRFMLHGFTELFGSIDEGLIEISGCGAYPFTIGPFTTADTSQMFEFPREICLGEERLTEMDRGIRVRDLIHDTFGEGTWYSGGRWIRTDLECHADPCLLKLPELYRVPLPNIPAERRLCGTGFGGGCDGDIPTRPAGYAEVEVRYVDTPGNGLTEWSIGQAGEFEDTPPPPVGEVPRIDVSLDYRIDGPPSTGAVATVTITGDREITFNAGVQDAPECGLDPVEGAVGDEFAMVHTFELRNLCLGYEYGLSVVAHDRTRAAEGTIIDRFGAELGTRMDFDVPPALLYNTMRMEVGVPDDTGQRYTAYVRPVSVSTPFAAVEYGGRLGWSWTAGDRSIARAAGWSLFGLDGQANACSGEYPGALIVNADRKYALVTQDEITITAVVDVYENRPIGSGIGDCVVGTLVASHLMQATVSIADLLAGVVITDDTGRVTFTIEAVNWRRELVG